MKRSRRDFFLLSLVLLGILAVAAGLRFYDLGGQSLWSDEGNSAALAGRSFAQIARDAARDIHPPLYYWLLHAWTGVFGTSEVALRSLSALLGVALVLITAELGRRLYGESTGLAAAFIAALAPFQIYYSQEARMYVLLALLAALSFLHFWWLLRREFERLERSATRRPSRAQSPAAQPVRAVRPQVDARWPWLPPWSLPLLLTWVAGLYTHYLFPVFIVMQAALYLIWLWGTRHRGLVFGRLLRFALLLLLALACFAPWLPTALRQVAGWPTAGSTAGIRQAIETALAYLSFGPTLRNPTGAWQIWAFAALAAIGAIPWRGCLSFFVSSSQPAADLTATTTPKTEAGLSVEPQPVIAPMVPVNAGPATANSIRETGPAHQAVAGPAESPRKGHAEDWAPGKALWPVSSALPFNRRPRTWYWVRWLGVAGWAVGPLAMMLALGLFRESYLKFLLAASPAYTLLMGRGIIGPANAASLLGPRRTTAGRRTGVVTRHAAAGAAWVVATLVVIGATSIPTISAYFTDPRLARDDYRGIAEFIVATAEPQDAILLDAPGQAEVFNYYYHGGLPVYPLPRQRPLDRAATLADLDRLASHNKVYVLYWASEEADPEHLIEHWLDTRGYKTLDQWRGNVRLAVYVMPEQSAPDETIDNLNLQLGSSITLLGYRAWNLAPHAGEVTQLQLIWRSTQVPTRRYKVFLQLLDPRDQVIAQRDAEPAGESRPTTGWLSGEQILDNHGLLIPPGTPPGTYRRIVGLYDRDTLERLRLPGGADHIDLPPITVARAATPPPLAALNMQYIQSFDFGGIELLGDDRYKRGYKHAPETPLYPGDSLHLSLYWQANVQPRADWWFDMTLSDNSGHVVAELQAPLVGPNYSTTLWKAGDIVRGEHDLVLPSNLAPDTYRLSVTLLPDTNTQAGVAYLGTVTVAKPKK